jgi:PAS domain S-box-containing protein
LGLTKHPEPQTSSATLSLAQRSVRAGAQKANSYQCTEPAARKVIDAIPQQIWSGPADGSLDYCNDQWRAYTGLMLEELQGKGWQSMLHPGGPEDNLFEAFSTTKPHGMRLGPAISRSIIEAHGGRLWAEANKGPGATFAFCFPVAVADAPQRAD